MATLTLDSTTEGFVREPFLDGCGDGDLVWTNGDHVLCMVEEPPAWFAQCNGCGAGTDDFFTGRDAVEAVAIMCTCGDKP